MHKYWILIICLLLIIGVIATVVVFNSSQKVDLSMTAYCVLPGGTVEQSFPITIQGKIKEKDDRTYLLLDIALPDDFRYSFVAPGQDGYYAIPGTEFVDGDPGDLRAYTFTYDAVENKPGACNFVINAEHGYFMAHWPDEGFYLVAATDTDVKTSDVIAHFHLYFDAWGISAGE